MEVIPESWKQMSEYKEAMAAAENLMVSLINMSEELQVESEIDFLESQINDYKQKISALEPECEKIFQLLKDSNCYAYIIARLHYTQGVKWEDVQPNIGISADAARMCVYRALTRLHRDGLI